MFGDIISIRICKQNIQVFHYNNNTLRANVETITDTLKNVKRKYRITVIKLKVSNTKNRNVLIMMLIIWWSKEAHNSRFCRGFVLSHYRPRLIRTWKVSTRICWKCQSWNLVDEEKGRRVKIENSLPVVGWNWRRRKSKWRMDDNNGGVDLSGGSEKEDGLSATLWEKKKKNLMLEGTTNLRGYDRH